MLYSVVLLRTNTENQGKYIKATDLIKVQVRNEESQGNTVFANTRVLLGSKLSRMIEDIIKKQIK